MSLSTPLLLLVLLSALSWSGLDIARKILARNLSSATIVTLLSLGQTPLFLIWLAVSGPAHLESGYALPAIFAVILNSLANLLFILAVRVSPFSSTIPFLSFTPLFTVIASIPLIGELPGRLQLCGIALIVAGALFINPPSIQSTSRSGMHIRSRIQAFIQEKGSWMMTLVALLWSITGPLDKMAMQYASPQLHGALQSFCVGFAFLLFLLSGKRPGQIEAIRRSWKWILFSILFAVVALGVQLYTIQFMQVSLFEALKRAIGLFMALLLGRTLFQETLPTSRIAGVLSMAMGVILILV